VRSLKRAIVRLLVEAAGHGDRVIVGHPDNGANITSATLPGYDISPVGPAIHADFYAIAGTALPAGVEAVFETATTVVTVTPSLVRPQWVLLSGLPSAIPTGRNTVRLQAPGWTSESVPVEVWSGPLARARALYSGAPKNLPYVVCFVADPAIEAEAGGTFSADPVLTNRPGYHAAVASCLQNFFNVTEDVLRQAAIDGRIRLISVFDETQTPVAANSLAHQINPNLMETRRGQLNGFVSRFGVRADVVVVLHGSTTHDRATAWFTTDDSAGGSTPFTYDGISRTHGHLAEIPGSAAIPISFNTTGLTAIHEFGHASSDFNNGRVVDLYVDGLPGGFLVNKKARALATDPIPTNFATYNGTTYAADQNRDGVGYPSTWTSYHPDLIDNTRPNMMDNYWLAANPQRCRLDRLTYAWLFDRLRAKVLR
jgi:hypothetical protein